MSFLPHLLFPEKEPWVHTNITHHVALIQSNHSRWLETLEIQLGGKIYGGWMEDRSLFFDIRLHRDALLHVGIDYWMPAGTPVLCPADGQVLLSRPQNPESGGWGARTDILINNHVWIFGHLRAPCKTSHYQTYCNFPSR